MTKEFCDLCHKEYKEEQGITVAKWIISNRKTYCKSCFTDPKNWQTIQKHALKERN